MPAAPVAVGVRSVALALLATFAALLVLRWASAFFIPLTVSVMLYYAMAPAVEALARLHVPRALGAALLMAALLGTGAAAAYSMADDVNELIETLPIAAQKLRDAVRTRVGSGASPLETVEKAAAELERASEETNAQAVRGRGVQRVVVEKPRFNVREFLWSGTMGLLSFIAQAVLVVFLTYFLLMSGNTFRRKLVKITGPTLSQKKITVQALDEINDQIQRYLLVQLGISVVGGLATGIAFKLLGLENAEVWGVAAGVLNLVPYVGSALLMAGAALVAFLQFGQINMALAVVGAALVINTIKGNLLAPWLTSKTSSLNPVAVFIGVLGWTWLWGVWGLLLGIPIMMVVKAVCDRVEDFKPVGELLGN